MSRLRMASGMAAAGIGAARRPAAAVCGFVATVIRAMFGAMWIALKALGRVAKAIFPWLAFAAVVAVVAYLGCLKVNRWMTEAELAAEATKHETALAESMEAAAESADDIKINARVAALVAGSPWAQSGHVWPDDNEWRGIASLEGVPEEPMDYRMLTMWATSDHAVRLLVMESGHTMRKYVSVEVNGQQAYLCVVTSGDENLWPWIYRGIGLWEHLLDQTEYFVEQAREQREIDSRFGDWKGEQK